MLIAIIALVMSAAQILMGIAVGLTLRKRRERQAGDGETSCVSAAGAESPVDEQVEAERPQCRSGLSLGGNANARTGAMKGEAERRDTRAAKTSTETRDDSRTDDFAGTISGSDRRTSFRRSFEFRQNVAPYFGGALPGRASFREVECHDVSSTGFSFLSSQLPDFESIVVALGVAPQLIYLQAQIVNRFQIDDGPAPMYRIGCRFTGQLN